MTRLGLEAMPEPPRRVRRRVASEGTGWPHEPVIGAAVGILLVACLFAMNMLSTQHWAERANPPTMDLSRRLIFAFASALELYGAGLVGFALGVGAAQRRAIASPAAAARALRLRSWRAPLVTIGIVLILAAGRYEYLALVGQME